MCLADFDDAVGKMLLKRSRANALLSDAHESLEFHEPYANFFLI